MMGSLLRNDFSSQRACRMRRGVPEADLALSLAHSASLAAPLAVLQPPDERRFYVTRAPRCVAFSKGLKRKVLLQYQFSIFSINLVF